MPTSRASAPSSAAASTSAGKTNSVPRGTCSRRKWANSAEFGDGARSNSGSVPDLYEAETAQLQELAALLRTVGHEGRPALAAPLAHRRRAAVHLGAVQPEHFR